MTYPRMIVFIISTLFVIFKFGECNKCETFGNVPQPDCKTMVTNNAGLRNQLLQRTLNFYERYEIELNFENYYIDTFSHMCDTSHRSCHIK